MSEFQTFKYLFLGEGFTCSEAAWTYGRDVPSQLRIAPRFCGILAASMLRWSRKCWVWDWRFWEQMPQVAARHNPKNISSMRHFCSFQHQQEVICESLSYPRYFLIYCAWKGNKPQVNPEIMLPGFVSGAFQDFTNFYSNRTAGFAPVLVT